MHLTILMIILIATTLSEKGAFENKCEANSKD